MSEKLSEIAATLRASAATLADLADQLDKPKAEKPADGSITVTSFESEPAGVNPYGRRTDTLQED